MAMRHVENELRNSGNPADLERADIVAAMLKARGKDIPFPSVATSVETSTAKTPETVRLVESNGILGQAIAELKTNPFSPEAITKFWKTKLQADGKRTGLDISVPDCDWTEEEIKRPMVDIKGNPVPGMMAYKPEEFRGKQGLIVLGKMYPRMGSYSTREDTPIIDIHYAFGWVKVEAAADSPNLNTSQKDLEDFAKKQGYFGQTETAYILASQGNKDLSGQYFDQGSTWSRLPGSRFGGDMVSARFYSYGRLLVARDLGSQYRYPHLGGRFEEVKKS